MKKFIALIISVCFLIGAFFAWKAIDFLSVPVNKHSNEKIVVDVLPGSNLYKVASELEEKKIIKSAMLFARFGRLLNVSGGIQIGEYEFSPSMKPREIMDVLAAGKSIKHPIVIPEGYNIFEIQNVFNQKWPGVGDEIFKLATDAQLAKEITGLNVKTL